MWSFLPWHVGIRIETHDVNVIGYCHFVIYREDAK